MPWHELPYCAMILVEPTLAPRELFNAHIENRMALMNYAVSATSVRRDTWKSREEAFRHFTKRLPWKSWDPRVVRILTVSDGLTHHLHRLINYRNMAFRIHHPEGLLSNAIGGRKLPHTLMSNHISRGQSNWAGYAISCLYT